ncbi:MAG: type IV toxin-antitoxin system AbiEi family antitoxin [Burkholderiaceae bacterium]|nr:type IV toxin-antitoxin system AbiEi family antitoxin [Burkholderiaceae bacterium]
MDEPTLIDRAVTQLKQLGLEVFVTQEPPQAVLPFKANAWLRVRRDGRQVDYVVEAKNRLTPATLGAATMQLQHVAAGRPALLVTDYLTPPMAERLRQQQQPFADTAGNVYLEGTGLLVYVTGRKLQDKAAAPHAGKAYTTTGLKVIFALLCEPTLADAPQRAIAAAAGVALGAIPAVLADLQQTGHLLVLPKHRRLNATKRLLDEWALTYARRLRAKTLQATYVVKDFDAWPQWPLDAPALWGGEPAANLLVQYLKPGVLTIYADRLPPKLLMEQRMTMARSGQVGDRVLEWHKPFWGNMPATTPRPDIVHPVLVYADLLATGDARCIETAQLVYDEYLARLLPAV